MFKPSKKVIGVIIIMFSLTTAFIVSDKIKNPSKITENQPTEGEIESASPIKSINEYMLSKINEIKEIEPEVESPKTVTDIAIAQLFGNYAILKQNSLDTPENIDELTTNLANQTKEFTQLPSKYSIFDLKTFPDYEKEKIKNYGNEFAKIMEKYINKQKSINEDDSYEFVKKISQIRMEQSDELSIIEVPRSISDEHLEYTNNLTKISLSLLKLAESDEDPILSNMLIKQYEEIRIKQPQLLISISDYFINNDIIFSDTEPGAMWNNI
jgi:hypothetical protein